MNRSHAVFFGILTVVFVGLTIGCLYVMFSVQPGYDYEYTVKSEQVNEDEMVDDAIAYENLTGPEKEMLYRAFKQSDHFLGSSSVEVEFDERVNVTESWRVIEIDGVPMLVAISGPEETEEYSSVIFAGGMGSIIGSLAAILTFDAFRREIRNR